MSENRNSKQDGHIAAGEDGSVPTSPQGIAEVWGKQNAQRIAGQLAFIDQRGSRAARKATIENTRAHRLIAPDSEVIEAVVRESAGKIRYFPTVVSSYSLAKSEESAFFAGVTEPLCEELVQRFPGKRLALRGISTSISGTQVVEDMGVIHDIADTVEIGTEKPGERFNVAVLDPEFPLSVDRVSQFASSAGMRRAEAGNSPAADAIFPAILVYDADGLRSAGPRWAAAFREGSEPSEVLLAAYVLDCPEISH